MDTTENFEQQAAEPVLELTAEAKSYLREAGKWASFLGIIGFIICGFILLAALFSGAFLAAMTKFSPGAAVMAGLSGVITVVYILIDLIYFFFSLYLYQFGSRVKKGILFSETFHLTSAFSKLKSFFKLWGILTIIVISFYALIIIVFLVLGVGMASLMGR